MQLQLHAVHSRKQVRQMGPCQSKGKQPRQAGHVHAVHQQAGRQTSRLTFSLQYLPTKISGAEYLHDAVEQCEDPCNRPNSLIEG